MNPPSTVDAGISQPPTARWVTLGLCAAATLVEGFDIQSTGLVAPQYGAEFHLDHSQQGFIFGLNNLGMFAGSILVGWATDRIGRRWAAILSMVSFGAFSVTCAFAQSGNQFALLRFLLGLCLGGSMANIIAITAEAGPAAGRVGRVTVMSSALAVGGAIPGVILGLWPHLGWRWIYQLGGWAPIAVGAMMSLKLAESLPYLMARRDLASRSAHVRPAGQCLPRAAVARAARRHADAVVGGAAHLPGLLRQQ